MDRAIAALAPIIAHMGAHAMEICPLIRSAYGLRLVWPLISGYAYGSRNYPQMISAAYVKNSAPTTRASSFDGLVTFCHNPPPIDSPILRSTIGGMRIPDQIKNADPSGENDQNALSDKEC